VIPTGARQLGPALLRRYAALAACLWLSACATPTESAGGLDAPFRYTARGTGGDVLVTGELTLAIADDSIVSGSWSTRWAPGADTTIEVGPQIGHGTLAGTLHHGALLLDLTPGNADNNAVLQGTWSSNTIAGTWTWITITGPRTAGSFSAAKP
jgi:hypothetical protein